MNTNPEIVGFLQCRYLRPDLAVKPPFSTRPEAHDNRHPLGKAIWARMLFTSQTGVRLRKHLGPEICDAAEWDNASPKIGSRSSDAFPADVPYILRVIDEEGRPPIILTFGNVARDGVAAALARCAEYQPRVIHATHPACRLYPRASLEAMRQAIEDCLGAPR